MKWVVLILTVVVCCHCCIRLREAYPGFPNIEEDQVFCPHGTSLPLTKNQYYAEELARFEQGILYSVYICPDYPWVDNNKKTTNEHVGLTKCIQIGGIMSCENVESTFRPGERVIGIGTCGGGITRVSDTKTWVYYSGGGPKGPLGWPLCSDE